MRRRFTTTLAGLGVVAVAVGVAFAQGAGDRRPQTTKPAAPAPGDMQLPPGMTMEEMMACVEAGTPGEMHAWLAEGVGVWRGTSTMWMTPDADPMTSECVSTVTPMMDGRYFKCEMEGEIPGMGPYNGMGIMGFDNVSQTLQATWVDSMSTGIMFGTGEVSSDKKTSTWKYAYNCPITQKPAVMRQVERRTGKDSMTLEMFGVHAASGKEFKMMELKLTREPSRGAARSAR
jgi:hypothetical protein